MALMAGICGGPLAAILSYATFGQTLHWEAGLVVFAVLGLFSGLVCIALLPEPLSVRILLGLIYPPAAIMGTMLILMLVDGVVFDNW